MTPSLVSPPWLLAQSGSDPMPWSAIAVLSPVLILAGVLVAWVGLRGRSGTLRRNAIAGIRTKATMRSDAAWEAAHRAGGATMALGGAVSFLAGLALLIRPSNTVGAVITLGSMVVLSALAIGSAVQGIRAAHAVDD